MNPLSGFRDLLSDEKSALLKLLENTFVSFGYQNLETPIIERQEVLLAKYGTEAQKLLYLFVDNGKRKVGLRYDLTLPLARFVSSRVGSLPLPFKRYEIGPVFRAEKPQAGRYRQFTQADIDIVGSEQGEEELLQIVSQISSQTEIKFICLINDRRILDAIFNDLSIDQEKRVGLMRLLDKKSKISAERMSQELESLGLTTPQRRNVTKIFLGDEELLEDIEELIKDPDLTSRMKELIAFGQSLKLKMKFDPSMVRGLDYYTGTIFEVTSEDYEGGSLIAGGRYDGLVDDFVGQKIPAVGISFGVDRLLDLIKDRTSQKLFVVNSKSLSTELRHWTTELRASGVAIELYLDPSVELGKQIKYADKRGYKSILIPVEESWKEGLIEIKNLETGRQEKVKRSELLGHYERV